MTASKQVQDLTLLGSCHHTCKKYTNIDVENVEKTT